MLELLRGAKALSESFSAEFARFKTPSAVENEPRLLDDPKWVETKVAIARQISNAIPIPLATAISAHLAKIL